MMKKMIIREIIHDVAGLLDSRQLDELRSVLETRLKSVDMTESADTAEKNRQENSHFLKMFISAKRVEGCSENTLKYYQTTIERLLSATSKWIKEITTDDLRLYLAEYQQQNNASKVTVDNVRRILSSFFSWLEDEDYICVILPLLKCLRPQVSVSESLLSWIKRTLILPNAPALFSAKAIKSVRFTSMREPNCTCRNTLNNVPIMILRCSYQKMLRIQDLLLEQYSVLSALWGNRPRLLRCIRTNSAEHLQQEPLTKVCRLNRYSGFSVIRK